MSNSYAAKANLKLYTISLQHQLSATFPSGSNSLNPLSAILDDNRLSEHTGLRPLTPNLINAANVLQVKQPLKHSALAKEYIMRKDKYSFFNISNGHMNLVRKLSRVNNTRLLDEFNSTSDSCFNPSTRALHSLLSSSTTHLGKKPDLSVRRVRFKPGYQVMWRNARSALTKVIGINFNYQKRLTRYLTFFYRTSHFESSGLHLPTALTVLLNSKLLPDKSTVDSFIAKRSAFLNGSLLNRGDLVLCRGDYIQLTTSTWLAAYNFWLANWHSSKSARLKLFAQMKLGTASPRSATKNRVRSRHVPSKILKYINLSTYISKSLEVDFFSMSAILLNTDLDNESGASHSVLSKANILKNYNWKYLN